MGYKVTIMYNQFNHGFTETWYNSTGSLAGLNFASPQWVAFLKNSIGMRGAGTTIFAARASGIRPTTIGSVLVDFANQYEAPPFAGVFDNPPDVVSTDAVIECNGINTLQAKRLLFLRGLNDDDIMRDSNGNSTPSAALSKNIGKYLSTANTLQLQIRYKTIVNNIAQVMSIAANATNPHYTDLTLNQPIVLTGPNPQQVVSFGVQKDDTPGFPRVATVVSTVPGPPSILTIQYRLRSSSTPVLPVNQRVTQLGYSYDIVDYVNYNLKFFSERKTGRPFGSLRGRSRSAVRAQ